MIDAPPQEVAKRGLLVWTLMFVMISVFLEATKTAKREAVHSVLGRGTGKSHSTGGLHYEGHVGICQMDIKKKKRTFQAEKSPGKHATGYH